MRYYRISGKLAANTGNGPFLMDGSDPKSYRDLTEVRFNMPDIAHGKYLIASADQVGDCLCHSPELIVSPRARDLFHEFRLQPDLQEIPAHLFNIKGEKLAEFVWLNGTEPFRCVDRKQSVFEVWSEKVINNITKWVFDPNKVPSLDLFLADDYEFVATENLRSECYRRKLKNLQFDFLCEA
jgi:hypothetical protein